MYKELSCRDYESVFLFFLFSKLSLTFFLDIIFITKFFYI